METNYNDMVLFANVAECGGFTNASKVLNIPKSTLSKRISLLEERLNTKLLNRSTRSLSLTSIGEIYFSYCIKIIEIGESAEREIFSLQNDTQGSLKITCPEVTATYFIEDMITEFIDLYPFINIQLIIDDERVNIVEKGIDFAFRVGKLEDSNLICRRIAKITKSLVASPKYISKRGIPSSLKDLRDHSCIVHNPLPIWRVHENGKSRTLRPNGSIICNSLNIILGMALKNQGVALLPSFMVVDKIHEHKLETVLGNCTIPASSLYIIQQDATNQSCAHKVFKEYVKKYDFEKKMNISL